MITMAADKVIKVWDIKAQRCIQTIDARHYPDPHDFKPSAIWYEPETRRLLTAASRVQSWMQGAGSTAAAGHSASIVAALSNETFSLVGLSLAYFFSFFPGTPVFTQAAALWA